MIGEQGQRVETPDGESGDLDLELGGMHGRPYPPLDGAQRIAAPDAAPPAAEGVMPTCEPDHGEVSPTPEAPGDDVARQVTSLLKVSSYLVSVLDPDELLAHLVARVVEVLPAVQAGILWLYERRPGRLRMVSAHALPIEPATAAMLASCQLSLGEGLAGQALQRGDPLLRETRLGYRDVSERVSPLNQGLFQQLHEQLPRTLAVVCVPLRVRNETVGVIELINLGTAAGGPDWQPLDRGDIPVLQTFGNLAAAAINNAQLYAQTEAHRRRLDAFDAVVTAISAATDLPDLISNVLDVVVELVPATAAALLLLDPTQDRLRLCAQQGLPSPLREQTSFLVSGSAWEEVVRYGQPIKRLLLEERDEGTLLAEGMSHCAYLPLLAGGTVVGVLAFFGDTTLHRHVDTATLMPLSNQIGFAIANVQLYEDTQIERRKLATVINSIAEGVVLCDSQGRLVLANEAAMAMLSLESVPFQQPLSEMPDFYGIRDMEGHPLPVERLPLARALSGELFHDYRVLIRGASGSDSVMSFSGAPTYGDDGGIEGAVVVFRDVTANQKLERAKDEFLAVAAHELRSPLAAVRSYADLLLRREQQRSEADPRDVQGLTILTQQVSHMLRMVDNLLDVSRLDAGQIDLNIQPVNLVSLANQVIDQQRPAALNRELILEAREPEMVIPGDSLRIRQVLTNLIGNAIKYSPPDSRVTVRITCVEPEGLNVESRDRSQDEPHGPSASFHISSPSVMVSVTDTGSGIPLDQQERLFTRFFRARSRRTEGLGLGLYLSRQFVLMHGGTIGVESSDGQGSTFYFTLPLDQ